jgi:hypothetical protein
MLELLVTVVVLGILAWGVMQIPMPPVFRTVAWCILLIILVILVYRALRGGGLAF